MTLDIQCLDIDAANPRTLASFWQEALGWRRTVDTEGEVVLEPPEHSVLDGVVPDLVFIRVPEEKAGKNRLHLDLRPGDQSVEVQRLQLLGAVRADIGQGAHGSWVVMADPEGNEFCVLRARTPGEVAQLEGIRRARRH